MKKTAIVIAALAIALVSVLAAQKTANKDVIRIHIRANSNLEIDQDLKYKVKDDVCRYLGPKVANAKTKAETYAILKDELDGIRSAADASLKRLGANYYARVCLKKEEFPARDYGGKTYDAGVYDALIVELGEGVGNNWWCVIYPQLCFASSGYADGFEYDSKIYEWIEKSGGKR